jgi:hypothetical protein
MLGCLRVRHLQWIPLCGRNPRITWSWRFSSVYQLGSNTKIIVSLCRDKHLLFSYSQAESRNHRSMTDYHSVENRGFPEILGSPVCRFRIHSTPGPDRSTLLEKRFARTLLLGGRGRSRNRATGPTSDRSNYMVPAHSF